MIKLEAWQWTSVILCGFGLFKEFRPVEPFLTPFLLDFKNVTQDEIVHKAFPVNTYTYLATLPLVFLLTDFVRYRPVVILEGAAFVLTWVLLVFGKGLLILMLVEFFYGIASSTEVAYYTYIYAKVDREHYPKVTSYTYSALFAGRFLAGVVAQVMTQFNLLDYSHLNYITLGCLSISLAFSLFLPPVKQSIYFHRNRRPRDESKSPSPAEQSGGGQIRDDNARETCSASTEAILEENEMESSLSFREKLKYSKEYMMQHLRSAYGSSYVLKWSLWWAVATAGHLQIINFVQALWETIVTENGTGSQDYNGAVEASHTLISSILAFGVGHVKISWSTWGEALLSISAIAQCGALIWMSRTDSLYIAYGCYMIFRILFQVIITVASSEVAQRISDDSFGLIFGINTFVALSMQTVLTLVVADEAGLVLSERSQFLTYGIGFGVLGGAFAISLAWTLMSSSKSPEHENINVPNPITYDGGSGEQAPPIGEPEVTGSIP